MKKIIFLLITIVSFTAFGQDTVFNFNTNTESFSFAGWPNNTATNGYLTTGVVSGTGTAGTGGVTGGFQQMRTPNGLGLAEADYTIIRLVVENSTNNTDWGIVSYDTGSTNAGNGVRLDYTIPTVASGSGFTTFDFAIPVNPDNGGNIDRLGIRAKQSNSFVWSGEFKIAQIVIINTFSENSFVVNADFETSTDWVASGGQVTGGYTTTDPNGGSQSGTLTFTADQSSNQFLDGPIYDLGKTVNPATLECSFWVKTNNTALEVQVLYDLFEADGTTKISGNNTGVYKVTAANTWEPVSFSKVITDEFNQIQFRLKVKTATALDGDVVVFDDITASFSYYETSNSWTGSTDTDWANTANWTNGVIPSSLKNSDVQVSSNNPIISVTTGATLNNLAVDSGASLTINGGGSLIVSGTSTGNVTYNRTLTSKPANADGWHLIASPVAGQTYNNAYATSNGLATSGTKRGLAFYNDALVSGSKYTYLEDDDSNEGTFTSGIGYSAKSASGGTIAFTGTINTDNVNGVAVSSTTDGFELLGVPYTSYINSRDFLEDNTNLDQTQIWVWEQGVTGGNFIVGTALADEFILAPGQGFFVKKVNATATVNFIETNQQANADTFKKSSRTEIKLLMNDGEKNRFAKLYYVDNVTKGFDAGWEGEVFGGIKNSFDVFSHLVEGNLGQNYQVQSLPLSKMESIIVPLGVIIEAGKEITFSTESLNLPSGIKVFLEDRLLNKFTRLDEVNSNFKITLKDALNGTGRFYLHTRTSSVLSLNSDLLNSVSIYNTSNSKLRITGLSQGKVSVSLFNLLGKKVMHTNFEAATSKDLTLPNLATGIYIIQLETETGKLNKKIILE